jgi:hypothetical protein
MQLEDNRVQHAVEILTLETGRDDYDVEIQGNRIVFELDGRQTVARLEIGEDDNTNALVLKLDATWVPEKVSKLEGFFPKTNKFASLAALTNSRIGPYVGAKIFLPDDLDNDHPCARMMASAFANQSDVFKVAGAEDMHLDVARSSAWTQDDLAAVHRALDGNGHLSENIVNLLLPDLDDVGRPQIQLRNDMTHPRLGGGLFCLLTMPYRIGSVSMRDQAANYLNSNALDHPSDSPDLLGAWCAGRSNDELCLTCFLPNKLRGVRNLLQAVILNMESWATIAHLDLTND